MNKTELKAYNLIKSMGFTNIEFHEHSTPDFTTLEDKGFEVKILHGKALYFTQEQYNYLRIHATTKLLIYKYGSELYKKDCPEYTMLFGELIEYDTHGLKVYISPPNDDFTSLRIKKSTNQRLYRYANSYVGRSIKNMDGVINTLLDYFNKMHPSNKDKVVNNV